MGRGLLSRTCAHQRQNGTDHAVETHQLSRKHVDGDGGPGYGSGERLEEKILFAESDIQNARYDGLVLSARLF